MKIIDCCQEKQGALAAGGHRYRFVDTLGIIASAVCLIHCLAVPVFLALLPSLALQQGHEHNDQTHILLAGWVILFGLIAIVPGYRKHGHRRVLVVMTVGLFTVLIATFHRQFGLSESLEIPLITLGNLLIILTHIWNRRLISRAV